MKSLCPIQYVERDGIVHVLPIDSDDQFSMEQQLGEEMDAITRRILPLIAAKLEAILAE